VSHAPQGGARPDEFTYRGADRFKNQQRILYRFAMQNDGPPRPPPWVTRHRGGAGSVGGRAYPGAMGDDIADLSKPADRYQDLVDELIGADGVTPPRGGSGFGRSALRFQNKIFAMFVRGRLVVKLPAERVEELIAAGAGVHFDANKGTPMREWLSLDPESARPWLALATEALDFARRSQRR
jgi:hypothetical protein